MKNVVLEQIELQMAKIENRHPENYRDNFKWKRLYQTREKVTREIMLRELQKHKDRVARLGDGAGDSIRYISQIEKYLDRKENKSENLLR